MSPKWRFRGLDLPFSIRFRWLYRWRWCIWHRRDDHAFQGDTHFAELTILGMRFQREVTCPDDCLAQGPLKDIILTARSVRESNFPTFSEEGDPPFRPSGFITNAIGQSMIDTSKRESGGDERAGCD